MSRWMKVSLWSVGLLVVAIILFLIFKPWAYVYNYQIGYKFNALTGKITPLGRTGYHGRTPIIESIYTIDGRPRQVCINVGGNTAAGSTSAGPNSRVLNCKLVEFNPKGLALFLKWHGADDYEGDLLNDLLKIYAYDGSGRDYPFLTVKRELKDGAGAGEIEAPTTVTP